MQDGVAVEQGDCAPCLRGAAAVDAEVRRPAQGHGRQGARRSPRGLGGAGAARWRQGGPIPPLEGLGLGLEFHVFSAPEGEDIRTTTQKIFLADAFPTILMDHTGGAASVPISLHGQVRALFDWLQCTGARLRRSIAPTRNTASLALQAAQVVTQPGTATPVPPTPSATAPSTPVPSTPTPTAPAPPAPTPSSSYGVFGTVSYFLSTLASTGTSLTSYIQELLQKRVTGGDIRSARMPVFSIADCGLCGDSVRPSQRVCTEQHRMCLTCALAFLHSEIGDAAGRPEAVITCPFCKADRVLAELRGGDLRGWFLPGAFERVSDWAATAAEDVRVTPPLSAVERRVYLERLALAVLVRGVAATADDDGAVGGAREGVVHGRSMHEAHRPAPGGVSAPAAIAVPLDTPADSPPVITPPVLRLRLATCPAAHCGAIFLHEPRPPPPSAADAKATAAALTPIDAGAALDDAAAAVFALADDGTGGYAYGGWQQSQYAVGAAAAAGGVTAGAAAAAAASAALAQEAQQAAAVERLADATAAAALASFAAAPPPLPWPTPCPHCRTELCDACLEPWVWGVTAAPPPGAAAAAAAVAASGAASAGTATPPADVVATPPGYRFGDYSRAAVAAAVSFLAPGLQGTHPAAVRHAGRTCAEYTAAVRSSRTAAASEATAAAAARAKGLPLSPPPSAAAAAATAAAAKGAAVAAPSPRERFDAELASLPAGVKRCPGCGTLGLHALGHHCHHISPGTGCPSCHRHYCFSCLGPHPCANGCPLFCNTASECVCDCEPCATCRPGAPCSECDGPAGCPSCA